jgi:hypothetical protein
MPTRPSLQSNTSVFNHCWHTTKGWTSPPLIDHTSPPLTERVALSPCLSASLSLSFLDLPSGSGGRGSSARLGEEGFLRISSLSVSLSTASLAALAMVLPSPHRLSPSSEGVSSFAETPPAAHSHSLRSRRERGTERLTTAVKRGRGREGSVVRSCAWSAKERSPPLSLHRSPVRVILIEKVLCSAEP